MVLPNMDLRSLGLKEEEVLTVLKAMGVEEGRLKLQILQIKKKEEVFHVLKTGLGVTYFLYIYLR